LRDLIQGILGCHKLLHMGFLQNKQSTDKKSKTLGKIKLVNNKKHPQIKASGNVGHDVKTSQQTLDLTFQNCKSISWKVEDMILSFSKLSKRTLGGASATTSTPN